MNVIDAMTIGASEITDTDAYFSNFGPCVDWYAPGSNIISAGIMSGTSMAGPHNAGIAAQYLQTNPTASPADVTAAIRVKLTPARLVGPSVAYGNNHLLFTDL